MSAQRFTAGDGCGIAFEFMHDLAKPVLLLSPSLGTAMALFDPQIEAFGAHFSILRYDPRGHGASDARDSATSLDRLGRDVIELLDHLGVETAHFCGVSLGGMTGQWLGYRAPDRIGRLILANTSAHMGPPSAWQERIENVRKNGMEAMVDPVLARWFTAKFRENSPAAVDRIRGQLIATPAAGYAACSAAIRDMDLRPTDTLIRTPCLIISGLQDPATPPEHGEQLHRLIADSRLIELDAAHLSNIEQAAEFNRNALSFLLAG